MKTRLIQTAFVACCAGWLLSADAFGQRSVGSTISRPSQQSGSAILGRVGGLDTGRFDQSILTTPRAGTQQALRNGGNLGNQNFFGAAAGLGQLPTAPLPQAFSLIRAGVSARGINYPIDPRVAPPSSAMLRGMSGLSSTPGGASGVGWLMSNSTPLFGWSPPRVDISPQPYFAPKPAATAFERFFEIRPGRPAGEAPPVDDDTPTMASLIETENGLFVDRLRRRALEEFAHATSTEVEDRPEAYDQARSSLESLGYLDHADYTPMLLLLHVAVAKDQPAVAVRYLEKTLERNPSLFTERPDVAAFFGDYTPPTEADAGRQGAASNVWGSSAILTEQARMLLTHTGGERANASTSALQAYGAWTLGEEDRMRAALARVQPTEATGAKRRQLQRIRYALEAALR